MVTTPVGSTDQARAELKRSLGTDGVIGVKVHAAFAGMPTADPRTSDLFALLADYGAHYGHIECCSCVRPAPATAGTDILFALGGQHEQVLGGFRPEPPRTLLQTFAWGATVAVFVALMVNMLSTDVLGTVGGDDTILIVCRSATARERVIRRLERMAEG